MKINTIILVAFCTFMIPSFGQNIKDRNHKATLKAIDSVEYDQAIKALDTKTFVIKFDRIIFERLNKILGCDPQTNFFLLEGDNAILQAYEYDCTFDDINDNTCTYKCKASGFKVSADNKDLRTIEMRLSKSIDGKVRITLFKNSAYCHIRIYGSPLYQRVTFTGKLSPLSKDDVFIGIDSKNL